MAVVLVRIPEETRDDIRFIARQLAAEYGEDFSLGKTIQWIINGYSGNPRLAETLREIIDRRPDRLFPENNPKPGV